MNKNTVKNLIAGSLAVLITSGVSSGLSEGASAADLDGTYLRLKEVSRREASRLTPDRLLADELAHDTVTHLLLESGTRARFLVKSPDEQSRIVRTATRNRHLDRLKMERRYRKRLETVARMAPEEKLAPAAGDTVASEEERAAADSVLASMSDEDEIVSRYLNGHSMNRIRADLKVSRHRVHKVLESAANRFADGHRESAARRLAS